MLGTESALDLSGDPRRLRRERNVRCVFLAAAVFTVLVSITIVLSLVGEAAAFLQSIAAETEEGLGSLFADGWFPRRDRFDLRTIVWHTLVVSVIAMVVATPLGLGAAVYLSEYAKPGLRRVLKPILEVLAGIPSVVLGYFALRFITPEILRSFWDTTQQSNPDGGWDRCGNPDNSPGVVGFRGRHAGGAACSSGSFLRTGRQEVAHLVAGGVPAALSGIVAALILGLSRAVGETMVVAIAAGATGGSLLQPNPLYGGQTMTGAMASLAIGSDQVAGGVAAFQSLFFVGLLLFLMTLVLNIGSERLVRRFRQKY